ncbi:MAG: hypothetical protein IJ325_06455 [Clostridia bacterium]|nr:hypothetical protein [Clostridia bacterium]
MYGFGTLVIMIGLYPLRDARDLFVFVAGAFFEGVFAYICPVIQEKVVGTVSWVHRNFPLDLNGGSVCLLLLLRHSCFAWGQGLFSKAGKADRTEHE